MILVYWSHLFLEHVEVVDNNSNEQIEREKRAANDKYHKVQVGVEVCFSLRLQINSSRVDRVLHHLHPTFEGRHLKQGQVCDSDVIERDLAIFPGVVHHEAIVLSINYLEFRK